MAILFRGADARWGWLSNFYMHAIWVGGTRYPSAEHLYQSLKTVEARHHEKVRKAASAADAKRLGRLVPMRENFDRIQTMRAVLALKFQDPELREKLLATSAVLVENTKDKFWGRGTGPLDRITGRWDGVGPMDNGENMLGQLLMALRQQLQWEWEQEVEREDPDPIQQYWEKIRT